MKEELKFENGKAILRKGRRIVAKVFDREIFFKGTSFEGHFGKNKFAVEITGCGTRECETLSEAQTILEEYFHTV